MPVIVPAELARSYRTARVVAIIPARYQSTRLPGKPLALIGGQPMIEHVYRRAQDARLVDAVLVATDDERIAETVTGFGGTAVMTSAAHATGTDRLAEVAAVLESDLVVNVQGDEPLMAGEAIDAAIQPCLDRPDELVSTLRRAIADPEDLAAPSVVKVVIDREGYALYFTRAPVPHVRADRPVPTFWRHIGLYVYRRAFLLMASRLEPTPLEQAEGLEQLRFLEHGVRIATIETTVDALGVDTPEDLERVRRVVRSGQMVSGIPLRRPS